MRFIAIIGEAGSGKTTLMTSLLIRSAVGGNRIVSNYHLNVPAIESDFGVKLDHLYMTYQELASLPASLTGSVVGMDEMAKGADSYDFFSHQSRHLTTLVAESRKRQAIMYFNVQRFGMIAKRLRDQVNGFILMEDGDKDTPHCICSTVKLNLRGCTCGRNGYKCARAFFMSSVDDSFRVIKREEPFDGRPWGKYFNTNEVIYSAGEEPDKSKAGPVLAGT